MKEYEMPPGLTWSPEDRFYHAKDNTWWHMDDGKLKRAEPPRLTKDITDKMNSDQLKEWRAFQKALEDWENNSG